MIEIRPVGQDEFPAIARLADEIWHEYFPFLLSEAQIDYMLQRFLSVSAMQEQSKEGYRYFGIFADGALQGFVALCKHGKRMFLSKLYLRATVRGKGYGTQAMQFVTQYAKSQGCTCVYLTCNRHNTPSLERYYHLGFRKIASEVTDIGNGFCMDDDILELAV